MIYVLSVLHSALSERHTDLRGGDLSCLVPLTPSVQGDAEQDKEGGVQRRHGSSVRRDLTRM